MNQVTSHEARSDRVLDYVGEFTLEVTAPPEIAPGGVVNGASFTPKVAPGALFSVFGSSLATATQSAAALPLATNLAGTSVTIGGKQAPLVFVSPSQINAQVPYETLEAQTVPVVVAVNNTDNTAATNSYVIAYLTGAGRPDDAVGSGATAGAEPLSRLRGPVTATIAGMPADVAFGGLTPGFVGPMQVHLKVPNLQPGTYPLIITVNGEKSKAAMITVQ